MTSSLPRTLASPHPRESPPEGVQPFRLLVTGWRGWPNAEADRVEAVLAGWVQVLRRRGAPPGMPRPTVTAFGNHPVVLMHGMCPFGGVDTHAGLWGKRVTGVDVEVHDPDLFGTGPTRFTRRNTHMVRIASWHILGGGHAICLAFPGRSSAGTWDCAGKAILAGIPTYFYPYEAHDGHDRQRV